ncbi:ABC-2 type transport system permease protein [Actinoplanes tereljensis]|uniref:Transporter n=1 Tax=Paractinoplanes tereljensis TaxID=571912 RepID=A0A919NMX1_9ACTN|nr:ABC-2 family transporter protein [Actinoplanes tereljensis]GIF21060.1 transporter [Actinoplanes tereljensis]
MGEIRAYAALAGGKWRSMLSYRASFAAEMLSNVGATVLDVTTVFVLFRATAQIGGFTLAQAILMTGLTAFGFVLADMTVGNIDDLKRYVRTGQLDTMLTRPLPVLPQLVFTDLPLRKLLRLVFGATIYGIALAANDIDWTPARVVLAAVVPVGAAFFFGAIFVLTASFAFWWVESGEIGNGFTYGGRDFTSYPITVYSNWFRDLFAYTLGFGFVSYQPALALLGRTDPLGLPAWAGYVSPLVALPAVAIATAVWRVGIRHYRSTGS